MKKHTITTEQLIRNASKKRLTITTAHVVTDEQLLSEASKLYVKMPSHDAQVALSVLLQCVGIDYETVYHAFIAAEEEAAK